MLLAGAPPAHADARTAEILMRECTKHFNALEYELAASKCEASLKADPTVVGAMRYLAVITRALGKKTGEQRYYHQCIAWAEMYLRERPTGKYTDRMKDEVNACRKALGQKELPKVQTQGQTGALVITCDVEGATVSIDDLRRGATPLNPIQVTPGRHTVTVYKFGYLPFTAVVEVVTKQVQEVKVSLQRDPNAPTEQPTSRPWGGGGDGGGGAPEREEGTVKLDVAPSAATVTVDGQARMERTLTLKPGTYAVRVEAAGHEPWERRVVVTKGATKEFKIELRALAERRRARTWAWTLTGAAAVTAGVGAYFGIAESNNYRKASTLYETARRGGFAPDTRSRIAGYRSDGDTQKVIATTALGVSLAALAGAVALWIYERGDEHPAGEAPALAVTPTPLPGGGALMLSRSFAWGAGQ
jgi:hypothetical protein